MVDAAAIDDAVLRGTEMGEIHFLPVGCVLFKPARAWLKIL
jgi:hypothetical protein